jgi:hypothetical protein
MLAFPEMLKTFVRKVFLQQSPLRKVIFEKAFDLIAIIFSIYLALSIEGWSDKSSEHRKLMNYYQNMVREIETDTVSLYDCIKDAEDHIKNESRQLGLLRRYEPSKQDSVTAFFEGMISTIVFDASSMISYQSMIVSGDFKLIDNLEVRTGLISLDEEYKGVKLWDDLYIDFFRNEVLNDFFQSFNWLEQELIDNNYYIKPGYINMVVKCHTYNSSRVEQYKKALAVARDTRKLLIKEITK